MAYDYFIDIMVIRWYGYWSLEALWGHSAELGHVVGVDYISLYNGWGIHLLDWLLGYVDAIIHN